MNATEYKQRTRKEITCPSGLVLQIRKVRAIDYMKLGTIPDVLEQAKKTGAKIDYEVVEKFQRMILTTVVIPTDEFKIVDKDPFDTVDNEISWKEIEDEDIRYIMAEVTKFAKPDDLPATEAGESLDQFSEEQVSGDVRRDGAEI